MPAIEREIPESEPILDHYFVYERVGRGANQRWDFVRRPLTQCICGDCDAMYDEATWIEDTDHDGNPMLVCPCGGQLYSTKESKS